MTFSGRRMRNGVAAWLGAALLALVLGAGASAQQAGSAPAGEAAAQPAPPAEQAQPARRPSGLLETIGRWFDDSVAGLGSGFKGTQERLGNIGNQAGQAATGAAGAAKGAVDAVSKIPAMRMVDGRERCVAAANGAPDCLAAATAICRGKGFETGKSVNVESAQKCSARALLMGKRGSDAECAVETYVTRAMCQ